MLEECSYRRKLGRVFCAYATWVRTQLTRALFVLFVPPIPIFCHSSELPGAAQPLPTGLAWSHKLQASQGITVSPNTSLLSQNFSQTIK